MLVVAESDELEALEADLVRAPERPALIVGWLTPDRSGIDEHAPASSAGGGSPRRATRPLSSSAELPRATTTSCCRPPSCTKSGARVRTLSLFYEQWLGKLPIDELERVSLLFDIGELHAAGYARVKRLLDVGLAVCGIVAPCVRDAARAGR